MPCQATEEDAASVCRCTVSKQAGRRGRPRLLPHLAADVAQALHAVDTLRLHRRAQTEIAPAVVQRIFNTRVLCVQAVEMPGYLIGGAWTPPTSLRDVRNSAPQFGSMSTSFLDGILASYRRGLQYLPGPTSRRPLPSMRSTCAYSCPSSLKISSRFSSPSFLPLRRFLPPFPAGHRGRKEDRVSDSSQRGS